MPIPTGTFEGATDDLTIGNVNAVRSPRGRLRLKQKKAKAAREARLFKPPTIEDLRRRMGEDTIKYQKRLYNAHGIDLRDMSPFDQRREIDKAIGEAGSREAESQVAVKAAAKAAAKRLVDARRNLAGSEAFRQHPLGQFVAAAGKAERKSKSKAKSRDQRLFERQMKEAVRISRMSPEKRARINDLVGRGVLPASRATDEFGQLAPIEVPEGVDITAMPKTLLTDGQVYVTPDGPVQYDAASGTFGEPQPMLTPEEEMRQRLEIPKIDYDQYTPAVGEEIRKLVDKAIFAVAKAGRMDEKLWIIDNLKKQISDYPLNPARAMSLEEQVDQATTTREDGRIAHFDANGNLKFEDPLVGPKEEMDRAKMQQDEFESIMKMAEGIMDAQNDDSVGALLGKDGKDGKKLTLPQAIEQAIDAFEQIQERRAQMQGREQGGEAAAPPKDGLFAPSLGEYITMEEIERTATEEGMTKEQVMEAMGIGGGQPGVVGEPAGPTAEDFMGQIIDMAPEDQIDPALTDVDVPIEMPASVNPELPTPTGPMLSQKAKKQAAAKLKKSMDNMPKSVADSLGNLIQSFLGAVDEWAESGDRREAQRLARLEQ